MAAVIDPEVIDLFPENAEGFLDELCKKTGITHSFSGRYAQSHDNVLNSL